MKLERIFAVYFSPTGTTDKTVNTLAEALAGKLDLPLERRSFTKPVEREKDYHFTDADLVVVGTPTYAGRVPNKILPDFCSRLHGGGALAVPVVLFGNRNYDHSLAELCAVLEADGFHTVAAGAFVGRHAFTDRLGEGRPDWDDRRELTSFADKIADKVKDLTEIPEPIQVPGDPAGAYYTPKGRDGAPVQFLKAKPKTNLTKCTNCGACARLCPMGAIDPKNVALVPGTCIKCQGCVRKCTKHAKYFDDPAFLSHVAMLEENFTEPKKNEVFL
ncbi:4Fe-4S binding protein [Oscillibacter sp.]|uniref:4Fe-4S binding protein n=1 Tax=Oscillibacter sp. TaxID=1945593 RepID=UPI00262B9ACF|nr:4Fe-4S binding protein [Oscillibacter sp.]MDD3347924.1 4Fe-4S binding protein [Oscillibacter sp.]